MNFLHISDSHIQKQDENEIEKIVADLVDDIKRVQDKYSFKIDFVCFTGDLIQRGDQALQGEEEWKLAERVLIQPLLKALNLKKQDYIFVPGNHEVDRSVIVGAIEKGLSVKSLEEINDYIENFNVELYRNRLNYFYDIVNGWYSEVKMNNLGYSVIGCYGGKKVGFACVDSAWRSSGRGDIEKNNLYLGVAQVKELYNQIKNCDYKICLMHHPIEWLEDCEAIEVEKELNKFDFVLRGHVHAEDDKQMVRREYKTIYSTAGKLYPIESVNGKHADCMNGYTIVSVNAEECTLYLRTYYGRNREAFGPAENLEEDGIRRYSLDFTDEKTRDLLKIEQGVSKFFNSISEKYELIRQVDALSPDNMRQILIQPVLADKSEYTEGRDSTSIYILDMVENDYNVLLIGKKESGKTTILKQIALAFTDNYESKKMIPVYVNMRRLPKGQDKIEIAAINFVRENISEDYSISKEKIREVLNGPNIVFLIDNVNTMNPDHTLLVKNFLDSHNDARFFISAEESFFGTLDAKEIPQYYETFKKVYVHHIGKAQIREIVTQWTAGKADSVEVNDIVNRIDGYCNQINFAKTPFNIMIFMVLLDADSNFLPINEGNVMKRYLEIVLEKLSSNEALRSTYSFEIKEDFLSYIAHRMYLKGEYFFEYNEYINVVTEYHDMKAFNLAESKFDTLFIEKNILCHNEGLVSFAHSSFLEYFLAVFAFKNQSFLDEITQKGRRIDFQNEICFYSGLNQDCVSLLDSLSNSILYVILKYVDMVDELNEIEILTEFKQSKDELINLLKQNRLSQEELDKLSDKSHVYKEKRPRNIKANKKTDNVKDKEGKAKINDNDAEDFLSLLKMYGSVIKNAELLDAKNKLEHLENYMCAVNLLYALMIKMSEQIRNKLSYADLEEDKDFYRVNSAEEFEKQKEEVLEFTKMAFPIAIQRMIYENIGTPKLDRTILELAKKKGDKAFEKFMLVFLRSDLKKGNIKKELLDYIKNENSKSILKLILIKLTFYYRMRFFGEDLGVEKDLIDLITEVKLKLEPIKYPNQRKSMVASLIKKDLDQKL